MTAGRSPLSTLSAPLDVAVNFDEPRVIVRVMLTFDRAADLFLDDCVRLQWSPRTISTYRRTYEELNDRLPRDYDVSKITVDDVRRYLATKKHLAPGTVAGVEAHLSSLFKWLVFERKIARNPMETLPRTRRKRPEDLEVVTVDVGDVRKLLTAGYTWPERLAPAMPAYLGPRRHAIASARLTDYDRDGQRMRFDEKGGQTIWKPVPAELANLIAAAEAAGAYEHYDYVVPPEGYLQRTGKGETRDDRVIWRIIRRLADRTGVVCHVHALRAAFAVFYDETFPGDVLALRDLMGHRSVKTTELYLRRRDKEAGMQRVRSLSWGVALEGDAVVARNPQFAEFMLESSPAVGAGGFEPPSDDSPREHRRSSQQQQVEATRAARAAAELRRQLDPDTIGMPDAVTSEASQSTGRAES